MKNADKNEFASIEDVRAALKPNDESLLRLINRVDDGIIPATLLVLIMGGLIGAGISILFDFNKIAYILTCSITAILSGSIFFRGIVQYNYYWNTEDAEEIFNKIIPHYKRRLKKQQREQFIIAQNFLNDNKLYTKLYEDYDNLFEAEDSSNELKIDAIKREWARNREAELAREKRERVRAEREAENRARSALLREKRGKEMEATAFVEQLTREASIDENGLVLTDSSSFGKLSTTQNNGRSKNAARSAVKANIQDEVRR